MINSESVTVTRFLWFSLNQNLVDLQQGIDATRIRGNVAAQHLLLLAWLEYSQSVFYIRE